MHVPVGKSDLSEKTRILHFRLVFVKETPHLSHKKKIKLELHDDRTKICSTEPTKLRRIYKNKSNVMYVR